MKPRTREEFAQYCLRSLGSPVIQINISDEQVDDRIDEALQFYADYNADGTEKVYFKMQITQEDIDDKYITIPENILGVVSIFPIGWGSSSSTGLFSIEYQIVLADIYQASQDTLVPYYTTMQHLSLIQELITGKQPIRYSRHKNRLYLDMDWKKVPVGSYVIAEAYQVIDPDEYQDVWGDRWLYRYATALIKKQWGNNVKKMGNMTLPGGTVFNGQIIYDEAEREIAQMESEVHTHFSLPPSDMVG